MVFDLSDRYKGKINGDLIVSEMFKKGELQLPYSFTWNDFTNTLINDYFRKIKVDEVSSHPRFSKICDLLSQLKEKRKIEISCRVIFEPLDEITITTDVFSARDVFVPKCKPGLFYSLDDFIKDDIHKELKMSEDLDFVRFTGIGNHFFCCRKENQDIDKTIVEEDDENKMNSEIIKAVSNYNDGFNCKSIKKALELCKNDVEDARLLLYLCA